MGLFFVWGQNFYINLNTYNVLTLTLTRQSRLFKSEATYETIDGNDLGELLMHKEKKYRLVRSPAIIAIRKK